MLKSFRYLLIPFSLLYAGILWLRNKLYDWNILKSTSFNFPIICVGNLAVGGTGKTPMVEYIIRALRHRYEVATLSRGYKRKTRGFAIASEKTTALDIGDEPMQFHKKFPEVTVAVSEERVVAIPQLLHDSPKTQVIILDDAFQHRQVRAGLNIVLTEYKNLYTHDMVLPAGDLRDVRSSARRADIIIVSKCKPDISEEDRQKIIKDLHATPEQKIFFTTIKYDIPYHLFTKERKLLQPKTHVLLVAGIANPKPLKDLLATYSDTYDMMRFNDHHVFSIDDLRDIKKHYENLEPEDRMILTTEKDGVRLQKFEKELSECPIYVIPIEHQFLFNQQYEFYTMIKQFIDKYKTTA
jgi:tetraacyldisaccharide 4'-kinase